MVDWSSIKYTQKTSVMAGCVPPYYSYMYLQQTVTNILMRSVYHYFQPGQPDKTTLQTIKSSVFQI